MSAGYGTEVAFRLGEGQDQQARAVAADLHAAAAGCLGQVLFLNDAGEYGVLAEWATLAEAEGYAARPATATILDRLAERLGRRPGVRVYRMERAGPS
ncbi:MAG: hypothetical protein RIB67_00655 [Miltoncostaeaceae bacterium]